MYEDEDMAREPPGMIQYNQEQNNKKNNPPTKQCARIISFVCLIADDVGLTIGAISSAGTQQGCHCNERNPEHLRGRTAEDTRKLVWCSPKNNAGMMTLERPEVFFGRFFLQPRKRDFASSFPLTAQLHARADVKQSHWFLVPHSLPA